MTLSNRWLGAALGAVLAAASFLPAHAADKIKLGVIGGDEEEIAEVVKKVAAKDGLEIQIVAFSDLPCRTRRSRAAISTPTPSSTSPISMRRSPPAATRSCPPASPSSSDRLLFGEGESLQGSARGRADRHSERPVQLAAARSTCWRQTA